MILAVLLSSLSVATFVDKPGDYGRITVGAAELLGANPGTAHEVAPEFIVLILRTAEFLPSVQ